MFLFVGLGNPGESYSASRHNAGFLLADSIAAAQHISWENQRRVLGQIARTDRLMLLKPQTYMNASGESVQKTIRYYQPSVLPRSNASALELRDLWVAFDDLDIPLGSCKIQFGKGPKVHNGLLSIYQQLGTEQFWHVRIGIDGREGDRSLPGHAYVLQNFTEKERVLLQQSFQIARTQLEQSWQSISQPS